jgi:hypothetical protein
LLRHFDNAVFNFIHSSRDHNDEPDFQAVRGAFHQGEQIAPSSGFHEASHVQIALRDHSCIVGWFLPGGIPLMALETYAEKRALQAAMETSRKPRRRPQRANSGKQLS